MQKFSHSQGFSSRIGTMLLLAIRGFVKITGCALWLVEESTLLRSRLIVESDKIADKIRSPPPITSKDAHTKNGRGTRGWDLLSYRRDLVFQLQQNVVRRSTTLPPTSVSCTLQIQPLLTSCPFLSP